MESEESQQCFFCGLSFIDWKFHLGIHNECKMLEEKEGYWLLGRKRQEMEGLEDALRLVDSHLQLDLDEEEDVDDQEELLSFKEVDEQEEKLPFEDMEELDETMSFEDLDELEEQVSFEDVNQQPDVIGYVGELDEDTVPFGDGLQMEEVVDQDEDTLPFEVVEPNLVWNLVSIEDLPEETSNSPEVSSSPDGKTKTFRLKDLFRGSS